MQKLNGLKYVVILGLEDIELYEKIVEGYVLWWQLQIFGEVKYDVKIKKHRLQVGNIDWQILYRLENNVWVIQLEREKIDWLLNTLDEEHYAKNSQL